MSDRSGGDSGSRWSGSRAREERERRQREAEAKKAENRRLTDDERRTISQYRFPASSGPAGDAERGARNRQRASSSGGESSDQAIDDAPATETPRPRTRSKVGTSRRWRESLAAAEAAAGDANAAAALPPLPGDPSSGASAKGSAGARVVILGAVLFLIMGIGAFLPFGPLGGDDADPTPTPNPIAAGNGDSEESGDEDDEPTAVPTVRDTQDNEQIVCIDPGHGGWDPGWVRSVNSDPPYASPEVSEAELNLGMAHMLRDVLVENGVTVVMTRESGGAVNWSDADVNGDGETRLTEDDPERAEQAGDRDELQARINICNEAEADILISIHLNGFDDRNVRGYEVIYTAEREFGILNNELATLIYRRLYAAMTSSSYDAGVDSQRGPKPDSDQDVEMHDFGSERHYIMTGPAVRNNDYEIVPSAMPGVIVEGLFLSNDQDAAFIMDVDNQRMIANAYAEGIFDYFERNPG